MPALLGDRLDVQSVAKVGFEKIYDAGDSVGASDTQYEVSQLVSPTGLVPFSTKPETASTKPYVIRGFIWRHEAA